MQFANIKNDIAFRKIFGNENRKEVLISFLNSILGFRGKQRIVSVNILEPCQLSNFRGFAAMAFDVKVTNRVGQDYIVEIQVAEKDGFNRQVLQYMSESNEAETNRNDFYKKYKPAIFIGILDFIHLKSPSYINRNYIQAIDTGVNTIKNVEFTMIELPKFNLEIVDSITLMEKWIYFLKNSEEMVLIPTNIKDIGLLAAYEEASLFTWSKQELADYDYVFMREEDMRAQKDFAIKKALKQLNTDNEAKGEKIAATNCAKAMKKAGEPTEKIQAYTGLTAEEIVKL